ncbi:MAG TPA: hypothetical protein VG756_22140 [Pseudonocardiaceae bacterium]|nr:hypothetical protein [Pseudonocardiaceae bacterium]
MRHFVGLVALVLVSATALAGCSSSKSQTDLQVAPNLVAATAASSPPPAVTPAGDVIPLPGNASAIVTDIRSDTLAVAIAKPAEVLLFPLANPHATARVVALPGPVDGLSLAAPGGPLLAAVPTANQVLRITLPAGAVSSVPVPGGPTSAAQLDGQLLVAVPARKAVDVFTGATLARTITGDVTPQQVVVSDGKAVLLDQLQSAVFDIELSGKGSVGTGLRAGDGATNAVADNFGRVLVTDTRTGELLAFSAGPVLMRQRYPVAGSPYGIAYDGNRDLAWVSVTKLNQVVGFAMVGGTPVQKYTLPTVRQPDSVAVDPTSGRVFVASADGGGVQVIQP